MREGVLSDESVMKMCAEYRPIPLGQVSRILNAKRSEPVLQTRAPKYSQPPARPAFFGAMSLSMAKQMDPTNPNSIRATINAQYDGELSEPATTPMPLPIDDLEDLFAEAFGLSPYRTPLRRETADRASTREALEDPEIAARVLHSPGVMNLRNRSYPNVVRAAFGSNNLARELMEGGSSSSDWPDLADDFVDDPKSPYFV